MPRDLGYSKYIDHTVLKVDTLSDKIDKFCDEAISYQFASVCVNPYWVKYASQRLRGSSTKVAAVVGFPLGANKTQVKVLEAKLAIEDGAREIDMVINVAALKESKIDYVLHEIKQVVDVSHPMALVKVIIETSELTQEEIVLACELILQANADFVKTSTGFGRDGAKEEDVRLIKSIVGERCQIKASTGINSHSICDKMIAAGATRMGTSKGIQIVEDVSPAESKESY